MLVGRLRVVLWIYSRERSYMLNCLKFLVVSLYELKCILISFSPLLRWVSYDGYQSWLKIELFLYVLVFHDSSVGKESACNAGDPGLILGLGRSIGEGIGYLLQYYWASLIAQVAKNPPAMQETLVWFLGWEDPLEKGQATHSSIFGFLLCLSCWRICLQCERPGFDPSVGKISWRRERLPSPVFWPGEFHGLYKEES